MLQEILLKRLHILSVGKAETNLKKKLGFLAELGSMGYKVTNPEAYNDSVLHNYSGTISILQEMKGGNVNYVPLFQGFPNEVPDQDEYFVKRIVGFVSNYIKVSEGEALDSGFIVPEWLFDLEEFGADPITQFQDKSLFKKGILSQLKRKKDSNTVWFDLQIKNHDYAICALKEYLQSILYSKSSVKEELKDHIVYLLNYFKADDIDADRVVFKETKSYLMKFYWDRKDYKALESYLKTPTDCLRLFAALTDSDTSLTAKIKFPKLKRAQRRFILYVINRCSNAAEDMNVYKGLWLELGRYLHPGEYKDSYKKTYEAFDILRNKKVITFNSRIESFIKDKNIDNLLDLISKRPGIFARKLHQVLEVSATVYETEKVLTSFESVVDKVELKNLMVMDSYFKTIEQSDFRTIINKRGKILVMDNKKERVSEEFVVKLLGIFEEAMIRKIAEDKDNWVDKTAWVDNELLNYTVPLQQRAASDGLMTLGRGSKIPLDEGKVLRLFVYWKQKEQRTDLDLSLIKYDENMKFTGHISYTNLKSGGILHSGDIQSAEHGAAEFIDIDLSALKKMKDVRYIATQVYKYSGERFQEMDCHSGWMIRDKVNKDYKSFDIKTVQNKFDINGAGSYAIPIVVDVVKNEITFVDLYVNGVNAGNNVEGAHSDISVITREMLRMIDTRPNMFDLAHRNIKGRCAVLVENKDEADITFGIKDCDYNVSNIETVLSELI
ncbi:MAG: TerD family protein [Desulfobacterales bacterium]|nr:TerD family protein [Desulfobacterales bacterium]